MSKQKSQLLKKVWYWIKLASLLLGLICGSILIYQWWARKQELKRIQGNIWNEKAGERTFNI